MIQVFNINEEVGSRQKTNGGYIVKCRVKKFVLTESNFCNTTIKDVWYRERLVFIPE